MQLKNITSLNELIKKFAYEFYYDVPDNAKELLADFYTLTYFYGKDVSSEFGDEETQYSYNESLEKLLTYTKATMLQLLSLCISRELRHMYEASPGEAIDFVYDDMHLDHKDADLLYSERIGPVAEYSNIKFDEAVKTTKFDNREIFMAEATGGDLYRTYYLALRQVFGSDYDWISTFALPAFKKLPWKTQFGGEAWVTICEGYIQLYEATTPSDIMIAIDHIVDLQHNTGTVFTKVEYFYDSDKGYGWIQEFLDRKAQATNLYQLYFSTSASAQTILPHLIKNITGETLEDYLEKMETKFNFKDNYETFIEFLKSAPLWLLEAQIENMSVKMIGSSIFELSDGTWIDGAFSHSIAMSNVTWKNGTWQGESFEDSVWENGVWNAGSFVRSVWEKGTWHDGDFDASKWNSGTWYHGTFYKSEWMNGTWYNGRFDGSIWHDGVWWDGAFDMGDWLNGRWLNGAFNESTWYNGTWENGRWYDSKWINGEWKTGNVYSSDKDEWKKTEINPNELATSKFPEETTQEENIE